LSIDVKQRNLFRKA